MKWAFYRDLYNGKIIHRSRVSKKNEPLDHTCRSIEKRFKDAIYNSIFLFVSSALFFSIGALIFIYQGMSPMVTVFAAVLVFTFGALGLAFGISNIKDARDQKRALAQCERNGCREDKLI